MMYPRRSEVEGMDKTLSGHKPVLLWKHFDELRKINDKFDKGILPLLKGKARRK